MSDFDAERRRIIGFAFVFLFWCLDFIVCPNRVYMYIKRNISASIILRFAWHKILLFLILAIGVVVAYHFLDHEGIDITIPFLPLSTIGIAVAFYISFKNSAAYDRFWEARKIWGGIVNYSRTWANQVLSFVTNQHALVKLSETDMKSIHQELIYRHLAYINALRLQLRMPSSFSIKPIGLVKSLKMGSPESKHWDEEVGAFLEKEEYNCLSEKQNTATHLIRRQGDQLKDLLEKGLIEDFRHMEMMRVLEEFYNFQGKCERINNTPYPRQYAYFSKIFTWIFIFLLPFGLVGEFAELGHHTVFLTIPFSVLISWIFYTMEIVGDSSEDPFEGFINDVPMTALCRTIEIDLRETLGETDLPPKVEPVNNILM